MKKRKKFKPLTAVVFEPVWSESISKMTCPHPLKPGQVVYYLGDIPNVPGHCVVITSKGLCIPMVHPEDLRKAKDEEL